MELSVVYKTKDFWGMSTVREDSIVYANNRHLSACFRNLKISYDTAVKIYAYNGDESLSLYWDSLSDQENGELTIRIYNGWYSYDEKKMPFDKAKAWVKVRVDCQ